MVKLSLNDLEKILKRARSDFNLLPIDIQRRMTFVFSVQNGGQAPLIDWKQILKECPEGLEPTAKVKALAELLASTENEHSYNSLLLEIFFTDHSFIEGRFIPGMFSWETVHKANSEKIFQLELTRSPLAPVLFRINELKESDVC